MGEEGEQGVIAQSIEAQLLSGLGVELEAQPGLVVVVALFEVDGDKFARLAAAAKPAVLGDQAARRKSQELEGLALPGQRIEALDMIAPAAAREVDNVPFLRADEGPQLPVPIVCDASVSPHRESRARWPVVFGETRLGHVL